MDKFSSAALKIIRTQELLIGPIARDLAKKVQGLNIVNTDNVEVNGDPKLILGNLVNQYYGIFGKTSIAVSKDALRSLKSSISPEELPDILR